MKRKSKLKELDTVKLLDNFERIKAGTIGVIVGEYDGSAFDVEFFTPEGLTIDVVTTPAVLLELNND